MKRKFCVALVMLSVVCLIASIANAGVIIDIKAVPGQPGVSADGKSVTASPGQQLHMQVWAWVEGSDGLVNDGIQTISGGVGLTGPGALSFDTTSNPYGYVAPFDQSAATVQHSETMLGLGGSTASTGPFFWRAAAMQNNPTANTQGYLLGNFMYTAATGTGGTGQINYLKPGAGLGNLTFKIDNVPKNGTAASGLALLTVGAPVAIVPEPATLVLLGMSALALVFIRRRK